jgi:hypothetical protein
VVLLGICLLKRVVLGAGLALNTFWFSPELSWFFEKLELFELIDEFMIDPLKPLEVDLASVCRLNSLKFGFEG